MKKTIRRLGLIFLCLTLSLPLWIWLAAPVIDDIALSQLRREVLRKLPPEAVLSVVSGCGNTSGTGNHTELYVAVLVREDTPFPSGNRSFQTQEMKYLNLSFPVEAQTKSTHVIDACRSAPCSWFDLRGS